MDRIAVWLGNGKIYIASDKELEVAISDDSGDYIAIIPSRLEEMCERFIICEKE